MNIWNQKFTEGVNAGAIMYCVVATVVIIVLLFYLEMQLKAEADYAELIAECSYAYRTCIMTLKGVGP